MTKPRVFVGSAASKEGLAVARAIQAGLERDADVTVWDQGVFRPGLANIESLERQLDVSDAAVLVFTPEDDLTVDKKATKTVRDNVLFELGLFIGRSAQAFFLHKAEGQGYPYSHGPDRGHSLGIQPAAEW